MTAHALRKFVWSARSALRRLAAEAKLALKTPQKAHGLPSSLILSLTSYPPRFPTLRNTLVRLLTQSMRPDRVILWIAAQDDAALPAEVRNLQKYGLEIRLTADTGPYKKIVPALQTFPDSFIATADDDINYKPDWLEGLVREWDGRNNQIVLHRGHEIVMTDDGHPAKYAQWLFSIAGPREATNILPTGAGGVLYPPGSLAPDVVNEAEFRALCPRGDDIWLYWMGRKAGATYKKTSVNDKMAEAPGTQDVALWHDNMSGGVNDVYIANLIEKFGWPI